jgi:hypothetical protein
MNMTENFLGIIPKLIPRNIHSKTPISLRKNSELYLLWKFYYTEKKVHLSVVHEKKAEILRNTN